MAAKNREKDQAMAARMKKDGEKRESARCPICGKVVPVQHLQNHVSFHP